MIKKKKNDFFSFSLNKKLVFNNLNMNFIKNKILFTSYNKLDFINYNVLFYVNNLFIQFINNKYKFYFILKNKLLNILHTFLGFSVIILKFVPLLNYVNTSSNKLINNYNIFFKKIKKKIKFKNLNLSFKTIFSVRQYNRYLNKYNIRFLINFYKLMLISLNNVYSKVLIYKIFLNFFKTLFINILKSGKSFFFFFRLFKIFFRRFFKHKLCAFKSFKLIVKGRFGKKRKQTFKLSYGNLFLTSFFKNLRYNTFDLTTRKGSYGFHLWVLFKNSSRK